MSNEFYEQEFEDIPEEEKKAMKNPNPPPEAAPVEEIPDNY